MPPGTTVGYAELAARIGRPEAARAVAGAGARNSAFGGFDVTAPFTPDVRDAALRSVLCWLATADAAGQPNVTPSDPAFARWVAPLRELAGERFPIRSVFVVRASEVEVIVAPSNVLFPDETTEVSQERAALRAYGVVRVDGGGGA